MSTQAWIGVIIGIVGSIILFSIPIWSSKFRNVKAKSLVQFNAAYQQGYAWAWQTYRFDQCSVEELEEKLKLHDSDDNLHFIQGAYFAITDIRCFDVLRSQAEPE